MSAIITTTELDTYTGETLDPARSTQVVNAVNAYIERLTGRSWGEVATVTDEEHDYEPVIFLRHMDIQSVTEVSTGNPTDSSVLSASDYYVNDFGRLTLSNYPASSWSRARRDDVLVTYTHGVSTVPADLKLAALSLASDFYTYGDEGQAELGSEGIGSYRLDYKRGSNSATGSTYFGVIDSYRMRRV